jgi:tetratricopeptide (TPR) repeat protein
MRRTGGAALAWLLLATSLPASVAATPRIDTYEAALLELVRRENGEAGVQQIDQELRGLASQAGASALPLRQWFFEEAHFVGERVSPASLASGSLLESIQSRRGPCLALAATYVALAEQTRGAAVPVATPRHVFVRESGNDRAVNVELLERGKNHPERYYLLQESALLDDPRAAHLLRELTPVQFLAYLLNNRAVQLRVAGDTEEAERTYREALKLDGDCQPCHYNYANLLAAEGRTKKAQRHYDRALELHPWDEEAQRNRGLLP